ncbi:MAG: hypothetical protein HC838_12500 [Spirulinaceae cyanobacterium RM2_2_10]|nr:hypothetical protein [Spirulinaceae cyanobacterium SM2_1_0]NJO20685.1 hypothetical protein [Spirulinaceae cyanobacterium RM2_2_10]
MKSLVRWCATLGLAGATLWVGEFSRMQPASALPSQQIVERLQEVPVFTITDQRGAPLVSGNFAGVFIHPDDAYAFIARLREDDQELASQVRVIPVSLGEIFQLDTANENQESDLNFAYVPMREQVQRALQETQQQEFQGVPLFAARGGNEQGYITLQQEDQQRIPFFFEREQLEALLARFREQQPALASTVEVEVVPLEAVLATLSESDNQQLAQILLVPSENALECWRWHQSNNPEGSARTCPSR